MDTLVLPSVPSLTRDVVIPAQPVSKPACHRCGASSVALVPDDEVPGQQRCSETWHGCFAAWRPHCPAWCDMDHFRDHEKPFREGVWFHHSAGIEVTTGETARLMGIIKVDLCTFERVRGGLEPPTVMIGDGCMQPSQARALASALVASAHMADMSGATLRHGEAHKPSEE